MITIAICEDEAIFVEKIQKMISDIFNCAHISFLCDCFSTGEEFLQALAAGSHYDIALLDIGLGDINGIEVADHFRNLLHIDKMILIYISSHEERTKETFLFHTHRFLTKPIDEDCLKEALLSAYHVWTEQQSRFYSFKTASMGQITLPLDEIIYFQVSYGRNVVLVTTGDVYTFREKITNIHKQLAVVDFLQIHYSFLINFSHIRRISYTEVEMDNGKTLPISGPKRPEIRRLYAEIQKRREGLWP